MVVTKVGQWSNVEDEVLKAAISKYGLNQWARCASMERVARPLDQEDRMVEGG
jgi:hypothetical protein